MDQNHVFRKPSYWVVVAFLAILSMASFISSACSSGQTEEPAETVEVTTVDPDGFWPAAGDTLWAESPDDFTSIDPDVCQANETITYGTWMRITCTTGAPPDTQFAGEF